MKNPFGTMTLVLVLVTTASCKKDEPVREAEAEPAHPSATRGLGEDARRSVEVALGAYEQARADLAADRIDDALRAAARVEESAREASGRSSANLRPHLDQLVSAAADLKALPADQPDEVRRLFGEVSRPVVALLAAETSLAEGRHVFECPMA